MRFTKDNDGFRVWFGVSKGGSLRTGLASNITLTALDPTGVNTSTPTVTESAGKAGMYTALIPSSFFTTNGTGGYAIIIEVVATSPKITNVDTEILRVFAEDFDSISVGGGDWSTSEKEQIRDALGVDGDKTTATGGQIQTIDSNVDTLLTRLTAARALALDNLDATVSSRLAASAYTAPDNTNTLLIKKILVNRLELADGSSNNWILYDDDDTTPLLTWSVTDKTGGAITQPAAVPSNRDRGT